MDNISERTVKQPGVQTNCFQILGIEEAFTLDLLQLENNYLKLQVALHPDSLIMPLEKAEELGANIYQINNAYRILKNPVERAKHLLEINNFLLENETNNINEADKTSKSNKHKFTALPEAYLLEMLELEEALDEPAERERAVEKIFSLYKEYYTNMENAFREKNLLEARLNFLLLKYIIRLKEKIKKSSEEN